MAAAATGPRGSLLLVVGGEGASPGLLAYVLEELERGVRSWAVDPAICSLDQELKAFVSQHSATFSSIVKGQRSLHHRGDALDMLALLNPSDKSLCDELRNLLLVPALHKLLVLAGPCLEETGELLLQTGGFSCHHFLQVLGDTEIQDSLGSVSAPLDLPTLTVTCPALGAWDQLARAVPSLQSRLQHQLQLNPPAQLVASEGLRELLGCLAESLEPPSPFELLEPPSSGDFLKLDPPCCYVFPGGLGDSAFFAVSDFTVLVNGGSNPRATFWKLLRHVDRVDAVLVTHAGADSLPGLNSLLRRKLEERREAVAVGEAPGDALRRLVSPGLGVVFLGAREAVSRLLRGEDEAVLARSLLAQLGLAPVPLGRGPPSTPTVLLEKLGVGRLDLHVLPLGDSTRGSACALLVWHPADPSDKVVRVLFPGCAPPARLLDGLARLQPLGFLREPVVTPQDLQGPRRAGSRESVGSKDSIKKEPRLTARPAPARQEPPRRTERDARPTKDTRKDPRPSVPTAQPREVRRIPSANLSVKKTGVSAASRPRTASSTPRPPAPPLQNGPCSAPRPQLAAAPADGNPERGLELPVAACTPQSRVSSPPDSHLSPSLLQDVDPGPDASPTATTPSLPAEVGSPHSTEVDESLSVSLEQGLPPASAGDTGLSLPLQSPQVRRPASPHDVDLCLVSPCEFEHRKAVPTVSPGSSRDSSVGSQERATDPVPEETPPTSLSESLPTLSDSEPAPATPAARDPDDDTEGVRVPCCDSLPEPLRDPPPLLSSPRICMVDPEVLPPKSTKTQENPSRPRKPLARSSSAAAVTKAATPPVAKAKGLALGDRASRPLSARSEPSDKGSRAALSKKPSVPKAASRGPTGSAPSRLGPPMAPVYLDLAYLPGGSSAPLVDTEFFVRVRALCYVISGQGHYREQGLRAVLDALLAGKQQWDRDLQVTLVPTFDSVTMRQWYEETRGRHEALGITVLGSSSMVVTEDEAFPACKLVF
ncbi:microtubule-associated protein 1S [Ctenodactylus gundi]